MRTTYGILTTAAAALVLAACSEPTAGRGIFSSEALSGALASAPAGYGDLTSSFVGGRAGEATGDSAGFHGGREGRRMERGAMMGGGLHGAFSGGIGFGPGGRGGPFAGGLPCAGTFSTATGRVECASETLRNGLTVTRSAAYTSASGAVQEAYDSLTTNTVNIRSTVTGTITFTPRDGGPMGGPRGDVAATEIAANRGPAGGSGMRGPGGPGRLLGDTARVLSATINVSNTSDRTVTGLAQGSTQRSVSGVSSGTETTTGTTTRGEFIATRTIADTTTGVVVPVTTDGRAYPTAGSVSRTMTATLTYAGQAPVSLTRREVVTYDGTATAKVVITENGRTRNCTRALPRGALACQ